MVQGIGTDLVEVSRIYEGLVKNPRFLSRFYGPDEQAYFLSILRDSNTESREDLENLFKEASPAVKSRLSQSVAANFAGKEAVLKVFGTGLRACQLSEIEILRGELGKPYVKLSGQALAVSSQLGIETIQISLSHTKEHALAFAIGI